VIPLNTNNGRILRLREKGLRNSHGEVLGDHYVHISIDIPQKLTNEEITTYKYLRELADRR
jgi:DnaJ-class molecular chaperone